MSSVAASAASMRALRGLSVCEFEQHVAGRIEDAGAGVGRRDEAMQHRADALGIDREHQRIVLARRRGIAGREIEQLVGIDEQRIGVDRGRGRDRRGDDVGLGGQALRARLDDVGAEVIEQQEAGHQGRQTAEIERDDASRQRRGDVRLQHPAQPPEPQPQPRFAPPRRGRRALRWTKFQIHRVRPPPFTPRGTGSRRRTRSRSFRNPAPRP